MGVKSEDERWAKFVIEGAPDDCWEWMGWQDDRGYGRFSLHRPGYPKQVTSNSAALVRAGVDMSTGLCALHTCDNPPCVNPRHLYAGTRKQNNIDCCSRKRHNKDGLGEKHWAAIYSDAEIQSWKDRYASGETFKGIARTVAAHHTTVSRNVRGIYRQLKDESHAA